MNLTISFLLEPIPYTSTNSIVDSLNQKTNLIERPRPKGKNSDTFVRSISMRSGDFNQTTMNVFKRQNSLRPSDLPSIQESKYKDISKIFSLLF